MVYETGKSKEAMKTILAAVLALFWISSAQGTSAVYNMAIKLLSSLNLGQSLHAHVADQ